MGFFEIIFDGFNLLNYILIDYSVDYPFVILINYHFAPTFAFWIYFMLAPNSLGGDHDLNIVW